MITIVAHDQTFYCDNAAPGHLESYGIIDAGQVRQLTAAVSLTLCRSADQFSRITTLPTIGSARMCRPFPRPNLPLP